MVRTPIARDRAYAYCERLARDHYENFPVASYLLPAAMRPHIAAIYAFARRADDFADEAGLRADFTGGHVLRHTFGTRLVREGHDLVLVAELMGHARLETTRSYSLPTEADREAAVNSLLTDR